MYDSTKLLPQKQFDRLCDLLPTPLQARLGRKRSTQQSLLNGILQVLVNDVAWNKIAECGTSASSCWRYFHELQRRGKLKLIFEVLAQTNTDIGECSSDTTTATSFNFTHMVGFSGKHKKYGTKISLLTDKKGLPADVTFAKGNTADITILPTHIKQTTGRRKKILNLDKGYTSLEMRRNLRRLGTYVNMETREGDYIHKKGPHFKLKEDIYKSRFMIERTNSWVKAFRHIRLRREYLPAMFKAFVYLALIIVLIRSS